MSMEPGQALEGDRSGTYLFWLPLGAGGFGFVRLNGRIYEAIKARREGRQALDLYHTALEVRLPEGRFIVENAWPSPDADIASRGVTIEGPVFSRRLARYRSFRYEVRCWRDGVIADADEAVEVECLSRDADRARQILELVVTVPTRVWGREEPEVGEMWNSNSVISYLLARSGMHPESIRPPAMGSAPGWRAGISAARSHRETDGPESERWSPPTENGRRPEVG